LPEVPAAAPAPAGPSAEEEAARKRIAAAEIFFEYDRARLTPEAERALKQVAADLLQFPGISFTIEGHADDRGASTYNKVLGLRRAETVMRYLVKAGVAFERMKLASQGEMRPKIPKKDAQSRAVNRRVTFSALP
jgi:peptidoglycan-associated lipoprotein